MRLSDCTNVKADLRPWYLHAITSGFIASRPKLNGTAQATRMSSLVCTFVGNRQQEQVIL